jgi:hypothetical protein
MMNLYYFRMCFYGSIMILQNSRMSQMLRNEHALLLDKFQFSRVNLSCSMMSLNGSREVPHGAW